MKANDPIPLPQNTHIMQLANEKADGKFDELAFEHHIAHAFYYSVNDPHRWDYRDFTYLTHEQGASSEGAQVAVEHAPCGWVYNGRTYPDDRSVKLAMWDVAHRTWDRAA